ncbi:MAG TPA: pyridoxal-dependent decarboxylase [Melioribacteraceae bacterium]|nr:pyridoxal-dependent decarboxylase [Melioribacteraceae bacterium]
MEDFNLGDMPVTEFKIFADKLIAIVSNYLENINKYPVLPNITPGSCFNLFSDTPPNNPVNFNELLDSIDDKILKNATHWNHPGFMAYFNSTSSAPGILAELLSATLNTNGMVWKSSPINTELEIVVINWMKKMLGLPEMFWGIIYDTASVSTFHGLAAAREKVFQKYNDHDLNINKFTVYCSEHAHSSVEKACLALGVRKIRKISTDDKFEINLEELKNSIETDIQNELIPMAVVPTIGTTSVTSIDDIIGVYNIVKNYDIWIHTDAAHAGIAAITDVYKFLLKDISLVDSIVINPHKWMFTPVDLSLLYIKNKQILKDAFSIIPEYLKTSVDDKVTNFMDYGIQLGRRFRALKLWFIISYFGVEGIKNRINEHFRLAKLFVNLINNNPNFKIIAPVRLTTICIIGINNKVSSNEELNKFNAQLMDEINKTGKVFLSHTVINGKFVIRVVISGLRTTEENIVECYNLLSDTHANLMLNY